MAAVANVGSLRNPPMGWLPLVLPPLLWAGNYVVGRAASGEVPPVMLALSRHVVALVFLLPFGWAAMRRDMPRYWTHRRQLLKVALAGMVAFNALVYVGLRSTTAANAQLLNSTIPVLVVLVGALALRQRLAPVQVFGLALSCLGVLTIILHGDVSRLATLDFNTGDLIVFAGMASFSLFSIWLRDFPPDFDRLGLLGAQFVVAVVALAPLAGAEYLAGARATLDAGSLGAMLYVGLAAGLVANLLYMSGIARVGPARASVFIHLVPVYGAFLSSLFLGERLHLHHAAGMAAILAGLFLSQNAGRHGTRV